MSDLIKREDAIKAVEADFDKIDAFDPDAGIKKACIRRAMWQIMGVPSADRPQGEWILECDGEGECDNLYRCSECGCEYGCQEYDIPNFCPNCGARMKGADDDSI